MDAATKSLLRALSLKQEYRGEVFVFFANFAPLRDKLPFLGLSEPDASVTLP